MTGLLAPLAFGPSGWGDELLAGAWLTLRLALATLPIGLAIGLAIALMRDARARPLQAIGETYATVFRALPELLTIFIVYFGAPRLVNALIASTERALDLPSSTYQFQIDGFVAGVVALALVLGAFSSEVFLGALRSLPRSQREAADALGFSRAQAFRLVILPQMFRLAAPGLANNWMTLLKDTSLVSVIALPELMRQSNLAALGTRPALPYLPRRLSALSRDVLGFGADPKPDRARHRIACDPCGRAMSGDDMLALAQFAGLDGQLLAKYGPLLLQGLKTTLELVALSVPAGFVLAVGLAYARMEGGPAARIASSGFMGFFRGTPVLCQLFLVYYGAGQFHSALQLAGLWWLFRDAFWCAALTFTLNTAAYQAEIIRGAVATLPSGQRDAADALGFGAAGGWRKVLLPQALGVALRPLGNELILMIKATSVASVVTVVDVMGATKRAYSGSLDFEVYFWAALVYLALVEIVRRVWNLLEGRLTRHLRAA